MPAPSFMFVSVLLLVLCTCNTNSEVQLYIEPAEGERCPQNVSTCLNITSFGNMSDNLTNSFDMVVYFLEGTHLLDLPGLVVFRNLTNVLFEGLGRMELGFHKTVWQSTVVIKCTDPIQSSGIAFANSSNITFKSITITNCGTSALHLQDEYSHDQVPAEVLCKSSLAFFRVANLTVDHVSVQNGSGFGLLVASDGFDVMISSSSFTRNSASCRSLCSGGNLIVIFVSPFPPYDDEELFYETHITNTNVSFGIGREDCHLVPIGGGLSIYMNNPCFADYVEIVLESIVAYSTSFGSNVDIYLSQHANDHKLTISNMLSTHAQASKGAGLHIVAISPPNASSAATTQYGIYNSIFTDNSAIYGGGIKIYFDVANSPGVIIQSTEISNNIGNHASGLHFHVQQYLYNKANLVCSLNNVTVSNNHKRNAAALTSAVYIAQVPSLELLNVRFINNSATGLHLHNSRAELVKSTIPSEPLLVFHNNSGIYGGGLAMYEASYFYFEISDHYDQDVPLVTFTSNHATDSGGAIYVSELNDPLCFFQPLVQITDQQTIFTFNGNEAGVAGSVLFGGSIDDCIFTLLDSTAFPSGLIFNRTFNYSNQTGPSVISSAPTEVCFCENNTPDCFLSSLNMSAYPGEEITIPIITLGQRNGPVPGTIQLQGDGNTTAIERRLYRTSAKRCENISTQIHSVATDYVLNSIVLVVPYYIRSSKLLDITMLDCLPGFEVSNSTHICDCVELRAEIPNINCSTSTERVSRQGDLWISYDNASNCTVVVEHCPFDYCITSEVNFTLTDPDPQCALNRTGTLCGRCRDGLSLSLGSNNCLHCADSSHIALILLFAAAGFGLVALLFILNLTVSVGTINGLIFFVNVVKVNEEMFFPDGPIPVLSQFISWLNLDLGIETCFFNGMTAYAKVWLQFVFPLFIWVIIATIIVLCRYSTWLSNKIGGNVVPVLATLILLSYTKIFRTTILSLKLATLSCTSGGQTKLVWYVDGTVDYFSWQHVILVLAALIFLLLAIPYTLALLLVIPIDKHLTKIRSFRKWWIKFKPLVDAYSGLHKDSCRFWPGLVLLVRIVFVSVGSFSTETSDLLVFLSTTTVLLISLMVVFRGIYQKRHLDILECWSLLNLALLFSLAAGKLPEVGVKITGSLMLVTFIGILLYHVSLRLPDVESLKKFIKTKLRRKCHSVTDTEQLTVNEKDVTIKKLKRVPFTDVCLRRETLLNLSNGLSDLH